MAANPGASIAAPTAVRVRWRLPSRFAACLIAIAAAVAVPTARAAQPPGDAAAELAAGGRLDAALALLDGWLAEHPGDARLFRVVLQVVTAAPEQSTVDAVLGRFEHALAGENVGVLRAVPADLAELRGGVEQALDELRRSQLPDAAGRRALLLLELGQIGDGAPPRDAPVAMHAGLARAGEGVDESTLEQSLRTAFAAAGQAGGGGDGAVAGYGLVALLNAAQRPREASTVLAELGRRYPRSPEYALAAAELRGGQAAGGSVVALPSPAMLLARAMLACPAPCILPTVALPRPSAPKERPPAPAAAAAPRQTEVARVAATPPPPAAPPSESAPGESPPDRVVLVPARVAEPAAAPRSPAADSPAVPRRSTVAVPVGGTRTAGSGGAARTAEAAGAQAAAEPAVRSRTVRYTSAQPGAGSAVTPAAAATRHPAAAAAPTPAPPAGKVIRVTAQPATRPQLATDRVFVPVEPDAGNARPSPSAGSTPVAAGTAAARSSAAAAVSRTPQTSAVRVSSLPDPAAFVVQVGAYGDPDNALEMESRLRRAGFPATARSYRHQDGSIVHRVGVGGNLTRAKVEQLLARLRDAGFEGYISRRDVVSYLPPAPRRR